MRRFVRRRKRWDEEGVASTVGTIMALLVFLTFLSLITNQYVPVWMKDEEAAHMSEALGQLGQFKSNIDLQILAAQTASQVRRHYVPVTTFSAVKLGVDGVPIFASPTIGDLTVRQTVAPWTTWFRYSISGNNTTVPEATSCSLSNIDLACGGVVRLHVFNRYFVPQTVAYENGALVRSQQDGQIVKGEPSFQVIRANNTVQVDFTLIQLFGAGGVSGVGAEGLQARVIAVDLQEYLNIRTNVFLNHTTEFGPAWYYFFNASLSRAYGITSENYRTNPTDFHFTEIYGPGGQPTQLRVDNPIYLVQSLWDNAKQWYTLTVEFKRDVSGDSVNVLPISVFRLLHAYVNVAAGDQGNAVGI